MGSVLANGSLDISFGEFMWSLVVIFFMVAVLIVMFQVAFDIFRDHELSGWGKAGWILFIVVVPLVGLLVYLIVRGPSMAQRAAREQQAQREALDAYVRTTAGTGTADEIAQAKSLLDSGAISQEEFDALKAKALG